MPTISRYRFLIAVILIHASSANYVHSYEQGTYFVFDIIESAEAEPTKGRLAIPAEALAQATTESAMVQESKRSEFEIDYKQSIQPKTTGSGFEFDSLSETAPYTETNRFGTDALGFESSASVFGE
jgi:hypothetical protein